MNNIKNYNGLTLESSNNYFGTYSVDWANDKKGGCKMEEYKKVYDVYVFGFDGNKLKKVEDVVANNEEDAKFRANVFKYLKREGYQLDEVQIKLNRKFDIKINK